jgi:hypothetical protein
MSALVDLGLAITGGGTVAAVITAIANRRKVGADVGDVLIGSSEKVVQLVEKTMERRELEHRAEIARYVEGREEDRARIDGLERREREQRRLLERHAAWDFVAIRKLREAGIAIDDAPPLLPPV